MALNKESLSKLIEILNNRDKKGPEGPGKPITSYQGGKTPTPTGRTNEFSYAGGLDAYLQEAKRRGLDVSNIKSASDLQGRIYDSLMSSKEGQSIIRNMWSTYGDTLKGSGKVLPKELSENDLANLKSSFVDDKLGGRTQMILQMTPPKEPEVPKPRQKVSYEGTPFYLPGDSGALKQGRGSITDALVGFLSKEGEYTPINQEDYERFAVPKWAQEAMSRKEEDAIIKAKIGAFYKGRKNTEK